MNLDRIKRDIKTEEGLSLKTYLCASGVMTIGYGHALLQEESYPGDISKEIAEALFATDLAKAIRGAESFVGPGPFSELSDARKHTLIDMAFNLGVAGLAKFKRLQAAILRQDWRDAAGEIINSQYARQLPHRAKRNRDRMLTGEEPE